MQQIITAIWLQDFDSLQVVNPINILLLLLGMVLFIESSFVLLPLPGVGLGLFVGGLVSTGAVDFYSAVALLTTASSLGTLFAYLQGYWLLNSKLISRAPKPLPANSLSRVKMFLDKYGSLLLFVSLFMPYMRVITPLLMGATQLSFTRTVLISVTSSIIWSMTLLKIGGWFMQKPHLVVYQESITRWFLISSFLLLVTALITLLLRRITLNDSRRTPNSVNHKG
ncbi:DedA family protein [Photobacterium gaetbulicola]|uniref:DedA family protein n=1 Tax=Photobacterium gaetbulicola TaxID=1295392 RepID=UPI0005CC3AAF|nr:VTT domain-containing protein [Photobacterium gaetbulicola]PSU01592.1 DedA family protein [Photobacterium gaetbulicola]